MYLITFLEAVEPTDTPSSEEQPSAIRDPANEPDLIAVQLQAARTQANLSVIELSKLTGISKTVLHGYERGRTKPGAREIRLLSSALNISPNRLILGNDSFETDSPRFTSIYRKIQARPAIGFVLAMMYMPFVTPLLDEDELRSILTLIESIIRAKHPETAVNMAIMADELSQQLDSMTLPDGSMTVDPASLPQIIESVQAKVAERIAQQKKTQK